MATVGLFTIGLGGHFGPCNRLAAALVRQGHHVIVWAPGRDHGHVAATGAAFVEHDPVGARRWPTIERFTAMQMEAAERDAESLIAQALERDVSVVVHDTHALWGRIVGEFLGLPRIVSDPLFPVRETSSIPADVRSLAPSPKAGRRDRSGREGSRDEALAEIDRRRESIRRRWGVRIGDWRSALMSPGRRRIGFSTERIVGMERPERGWCWAGPLMEPVPRVEVPGARPLVYVAFGTFFNKRRAPFRLALDALADEPVDVVVATGAGIGLESALDLGPLPGNARVHGFVASRQMLAAADVHITHGGGSSVHESLLAAVPMVCLPQGSDQAHWARRMEALGAARVVRPEPAALRTGVRRVLAGELHAGSRSLADHLARYDGEGRLAALFTGLGESD